jgi:single-strand DNA-binding protein
MNKVVLIGRLTKDPDMKYIASSGTAVTNFTLAVDRSFKKEGQPDADFIRCICFGKRAETIATYFSKGKLIAISGNIQTGSYEKDGTKVFTFDVNVDDFQFIEKKETNTGTSAPNNKPSGPNNYGLDDITPVDDGDIPF